MSNKKKSVTILRAKKRIEKRQSIDFLYYLINQKNCSDQQKIKIAGLMGEIIKWLWIR